MRKVWNRLRQFAFYPEEERIYVWILMGPFFLTLLLLPHLSKFAPLQLTLALGSISLSWMLAIFFGLETLQITQKMRSLEAQLGTFETEKTKLEQNHQHDLEDLKSSLNVLYAELDDSSQKLTDEKNQKESVMLELEKEKALVETMQQSVNLLDEELIEMKEKFRAVNSELKVYKSSSYTRYEVKHMVDELNRYRIKEKQASLLTQ
jgi:cell division protein ZapA (FtsZ GTPase activity inhibitor)